MKAYIIYHAEEAVKNASFIEMFKSEGKKYNIDFSYIPYEKYYEYELPNIVLNRTRDFKVSKWYEDMGIKAIHSSNITYLGNNKYETFRYLENNLCNAAKKEKWCADTKFIEEDELNVICVNKFLNRILEYKNGEAVIKTIDGHGGNEVFLITVKHGEIMVKSPKITIFQMCKKLYGKRCIIQEKLDSDSTDLRVYILMGEIYAAVLRKGNDDFRSNYSLGGNVCKYDLNNEQKQYIQYFIDAFGREELFMVGIDFIITKDGRLMFNELEEMVGSRMIYKCTDYDIVSDYVRRLVDYL